MKISALFALFFLYAVSVYAACSDFHSGGSCTSPCIWSAGSCKDPPNTAPTNISLSPSSVAENSASGTAVGTFTTTDTAGNTHTYTLVSGTGSTDNASFTISGNQLLTNAVFNYEVKTSYSIRVRSTDQGGLFFDKIFTVSVTNVNEAPTITAPNNGNAYSANVPENTTAVADVDATNPDTGQTLIYSLSGTDASKFTINSTTGIVTFTTAPNYENPTDSGGDNVYNVTVTVSDNGTPILTDIQNFTITVTDINELPIAEYRMDELSWNGTSNEVKDNIGTYNSTAASLSSTKPTTANISPAINSDPGTCRYGVFNRTNKDYIALPSSFPNLGTAGSFSITAWIKTTNNSLGGQRIFIDDEQIASGAKGYGFSLGDGGTGKLRFFSRGTPSALILDTSNVIANNTWYFVATVADIPNKRKWIYVYNAAGTQLSAVNSTWTETSFGSDNGIASIGGETNSAGENNNNFGYSGTIDEVRVYQSALNTSQLDQIRQEIHACGSTTPTCTSFQYDLYHTTAPSNKLQTRIAQQSFDLNVSVACTSGSDPIPDRQIKKIYAVTGTCPAATTGLPVLWNSSADINNTAKTITLSGLNSLKAYSNIKLMLETNVSELNCSTDTFAIRPPSYTVSSPSSPIKAADFTLTIAAASSGSGYNATASVNTGLQTLNPNCPVSSGFVKSNLGAAEPLSITFQNDINVSAMKAIEVGAINLNIKDATWTAIDQPNECISDSNATIANAQGLFGCNIESNLSLVIIPNNFEVNSTLTNANGGMFTYLSNDLNMSAQLALNITAKNSEGNTTRNYDKGCYAKSTTLTLPHSTIPSPLTKIFYAESLSGITSNVPKNNDMNLTNVNNTIFTQGAAPLTMSLNFDRNSSQPLNPFDFNITSVNVIDTDGASGIGTPLGNATFVYGRVRAYDVTTNEASVPNPIEFEVYSTTSSGYVSGMPQNVLKWYRNLNHDTAVAGNVIQGSFIAGATDPAVDVSDVPGDGIQRIIISSSVDKTVHLDISSWLWYSPKYDYLYTGGCTQHPCFNYDYTDSSTGLKGVNSGTFDGTDFQITPAKNITKKGIKLFR